MKDQYKISIFLPKSLAAFRIPPSGKDMLPSLSMEIRRSSWLLYGQPQQYRPLWSRASLSLISLLKKIIFSTWRPILAILS